MEEALQVESVKNEFFANISHEFKTPLNIILVSLQVIGQNLNNNNVNQDLNNFKILKISNSFYLKLDI